MVVVSMITKDLLSFVSHKEVKQKWLLFIPCISKVMLSVVGKL